MTLGFTKSFKFFKEVEVSLVHSKTLFNIYVFWRFQRSVDISFLQPDRGLHDEPRTDGGEVESLGVGDSEYPQLGEFAADNSIMEFVVYLVLILNSVKLEKYKNSVLFIL